LEQDNVGNIVSGKEGHVMKLSVVKLLLVTLVLSPMVMAGTRTTGAFLQKATTGSYSFYGRTTSLYFQVTTYKIPSGGNGAYLYLYAYDWTDWNWRYLEAGGSVPVSMTKVGPNTLSVNIPDLRQLVGSSFYLSEFSFFGPLEVNFTISETSLWKDDEAGKYMERIPQPDGTFTLNRYNSKFTTTSASVQGAVAGYSLPLLDSQSYSATNVWLQKGDYKYHFVP
jgi:hypothetical protein